MAINYEVKIPTVYASEAIQSALDASGTGSAAGADLKLAVEEGLAATAKALAFTCEEIHRRNAANGNNSLAGWSASITLTVSIP